MTIPKSSAMDSLISKTPFLAFLDQYKKSFGSPEICNDEEGKSHIIFILLLVGSGGFYVDEKINAPLWLQYTSGWTVKDRFVHIGYILKTNGFLNRDMLELRFLKDIDPTLWGIENISVKTFFENHSFLRLPDDILQCISFYPKSQYDTIVKETMNKAMEELEHLNFYQYYKFGNFHEHRKRIYDIFENLYNIHGDEFEISQKPFMKYTGMRFTDTIILFYFSGFIEITAIGLGDEIVNNDSSSTGANPGRQKLFYHFFGIRITEKFKEMIEASIERKTLLMDSFLEDEYKRVSLSRKNGKPHLLERELDVLGDETKFTELRKMYPHSDIKAVNYNGKTTKYEIKEKIKLNNN